MLFMHLHEHLLVTSATCNVVGVETSGSLLLKLNFTSLKGYMNECGFKACLLLEEAVIVYF